MMNENSLLLLSIIANILQVENYQLNMQQSTNDEIMKALDKQTALLLDKLETKLDYCLSKQDEILELLKNR